MAEFIFMLTRDDATVAEARSLCLGLDDDRLRYVGFKDVGLPMDQLRELVEILHDQGREVMLEVVSERREDELRSVAASLDLGVDYVLGGVHAAEAIEMLAGGDAAAPAYYPFPGEVRDHPSVLVGTVESTVASARELAANDGVAGLDLLAYRFQNGDGAELLAAVAAAVEVPVIAAGSIDSLERIRAVARAGAWAFTVGTAAFEARFVPGAPLAAQLSAVLDACEPAGRT